MLYIVYFSDGSTAIFDEQTLGNLLQACMWDPNFCGIVRYEPYQPTPPPPVYTCPYCGATFSTQSALDSHIQSVHAATFLAGTIQSALIWWEGLEGWRQILTNNSWPAKTAVTIAINEKNTGTQSAIFKVTFMGLQSAGISLNPGESGWVYLYPTTPARGDYIYNMVLLGDSQVLETTQIKVTTNGVPEPEFSGFKISDYSKI